MAQDDGRQTLTGKELDLSFEMDMVLDGIASRYRYHDINNMVKDEGVDSLVRAIATDLEGKGYRLIELSEEEKLKAWGN